MFQEIINQLRTPWNMLIFTILSICASAIIISIIINFLTASGKNEAKTEKKSIVETFTMSIFFICFYLIIKFHLGEFSLIAEPIKQISVIFGLIAIATGTIVNIMGRFKLGKNWANQIIIYKDQTLVTSGIFRIVRHPLYASLIWIFFGASILFMNLVALLSNLLIFVPFMYYRAKQEEKMLTEEFKDYPKYKKKVGMFFPKLLY
jgi:protein-S-isoprenylcysteine O-methyltransferase Ste14